jgi:hypothetical protein
VNVLNAMMTTDEPCKIWYKFSTELSLSTEISMAQILKVSKTGNHSLLG